MDLRQNPRRPLATELASSENPSGHPSENQPSNGQPLNLANLNPRMKKVKELLGIIGDRYSEIGRAFQAGVPVGPA